ncbi:MAG TPA: right-handed parallel beta-helix repeat-containing protein [Candidatus Hydrogenedentes bacterium]|nr:right-handed parallel beta-helix repeat-containing protein [Candidatus Hydrogenedentota bacterium]
MAAYLALVLLPAAAFALTDQDIVNALGDPANQGSVRLQAAEYLVTHPILLHEGQQLIGNGTTIKVSWPESYWFTAITVAPRAPESFDVDAIIEKHPRVRLRMKSPLPSHWTPGTKVALAGWFPGPEGARQTLFSRLEALDGPEIRLADPLPFSSEPRGAQAITLTKVVDMNTRISGIRFAEPDHQGNGLVYIRVEPCCDNVVIADCMLDAASAHAPSQSCGIMAFESILQTTRCTFEHFTLDAIKYENAGGGGISDCTIRNCQHGITLFLSHSVDVAFNRILDGASTGPYSTGIFLSGEPTGVWGIHNVGDKSCHNMIRNNTVDHSGYGVPGAGFAGIHLHRKCHYNLLYGNCCTHNGMGIYLETDNDYNTVTGNICSHNNQEKRENYYGNGIELDFDNDFNMVSNNVCEDNRGHGEALGYGIEIRNGGEHDNRYNSLVNNTVSASGGVGLVVRGTGTRVIGNRIHGNGAEVASDRRREIEIHGNDILVKGNTISSGNYYKSARPYQYYCISVEGGARIAIADNEINTEYYSDGCIQVAGGVQDLSIAGNTISSAIPFGWSIYVDRPGRVSIIDNLFKAYDNGYPDITCTRPRGYRVDDSNRLEPAFASAHRPNSPLRIEIIEGSNPY